MRFANRVAIVTGAARGIGKAIATRLASEGATVVIADILERAAEATAKELEAAGYTVMAYPVDVTDSGRVNAMVQAVVQRFARIDILCVTPALTDTDMIKAYSPEQRALLASKVPMGRLAVPSEIAAVVCFLASDDASFVTGAVYDASGGRSDY